MDSQSDSTENLGTLRSSIALGVAVVLSIVGGLLFLAGLAIYAAWSVHWSIGVFVAVLALLIVVPEGTAEKCGDHTPW